MLRKNVPQGNARRMSGSELLIRYSGNKRRGKPTREVIYVGRSVPPVTPAEIEIMFDHLETTFAEQVHAAENDN